MNKNKTNWYVAENTGAHMVIRSNADPATDQINDQVIAKVWLTGTDFSQVNAELIVKACNVHHELLAIAKELSDDLVRKNNYEATEAVLALAKLLKEIEGK